jgi:hypothetical protein
MVNPRLEFHEYKNRKVGAVQQKFMNVKKKVGKKKVDFEVEDVENLLLAIESKARKAGKEAKVKIRGLTPLRWYTFKGFDDVLRLDDYDDYFNGRVKNTEKFGKISQLDIVISY